MHVRPGTRQVKTLAAVKTGTKVKAPNGRAGFHLQSSPSTTARTSATLSMLAISGVPQSTDIVRNGLRGFDCASISRKPRRSASLTTSSSVAFRSRRNCSRAARTSSLMIKADFINKNYRSLALKSMSHTSARRPQLLRRRNKSRIGEALHRKAVDGFRFAQPILRSHAAASLTPSPRTASGSPSRP